jgi:hypothetical protein
MGTGSGTGTGSWTIDQPDRLALDGEVKRLAVNLVHGRLNVVGTDGPARVEITALGTKPLTVTLDDSGTLTVVHEDVPKWPGIFWLLFGRRYRADVSIAIPQHVPANLNVVSGSIVASSLRSGARVDMTSGRITLLGLDGKISAKLVSGPIEALNIGGELDLETVSGEITLADSTVSRVRARTISGSLTCDLDNPPEHSDIRLETTSGEITARVREDSDLQVFLHCVSGRVTTAFAELEPAGAKSVSGRLGRGTGQLHASATSGNIALLRRPVDYDDLEVDEDIDS